MKRTSGLLTIGLILLCLNGTVWAAKTEEIDSGDRIAKLVIGTINQINDPNPWDYYFGVHRRVWHCSLCGVGS